MRQWHKVASDFWTSAKVLDVGLFPAVVFLHLLEINEQQDRNGNLTDRDVAARHLVRNLSPLIQGAVEEVCEWVGTDHPLSTRDVADFTTVARVSEWLGALVREGFLAELAAGGMAIVGWGPEWVIAKTSAERQQKYRDKKRNEDSVTGVTPGETGRSSGVTPRGNERERERPLSAREALAPEGGPPDLDPDPDQTGPEPDPEPESDPEGFAECMALLKAEPMCGKPYERDGACRRFLELDGSPELLERLLAEAARNGKAPDRLILHWMRDPHRWKAVLADLDNADKERALRERESDAKTVGEIFGEGEVEEA